MKLIAYRLSNKGVKNINFMLRNAQEDDWKSRKNEPKQGSFCYLKSIGRGAI